MSNRKILKFSHWKCFFDKIDFCALFSWNFTIFTFTLFLQISWERHLLGKFWSRFSGLIFDTRVVSIIFPHFSAKIVKIRGQKYTVFEGKKVKKWMKPQKRFIRLTISKMNRCFWWRTMRLCFLGWWYLKMVLHNVEI